MASDSSDGPAISRREVLRRGAVIGGVLWAAPVIQSFTNAAAAGSPPPELGEEGTNSGAHDGANGNGGPADQGAPGATDTGPGGALDDETLVSSSRAGRVAGSRPGIGDDETSVLADRLARTAQDARALGAFGAILAAIGGVVRRVSRSKDAPQG